MTEGARIGSPPKISSKEFWTTKERPSVNCTAISKRLEVIA